MRRNSGRPYSFISGYLSQILTLLPINKHFLWNISHYPLAASSFLRVNWRGILTFLPAPVSGGMSESLDWLASCHLIEVLLVRFRVLMLDSARMFFHPLAVRRPWFRAPSVPPCFSITCPNPLFWFLLTGAGDWFTSSDLVCQYKFYTVCTHHSLSAL